MDRSKKRAFEILEMNSGNPESIKVSATFTKLLTGIGFLKALKAQKNQGGKHTVYGVSKTLFGTPSRKE